MRSRFTAHVAGDEAYLHRTYLGTATKPFVASSKSESAATWTRLVIHAHELGNTPEVSYVDFTAYFLAGETEDAHHEKAEFHLRQGEWIFSRALREGPAPVKAQPKVGRNDPCPCGSGRKFKHCCLGRAA